MHTSASSVMFTPFNFHDRDPSRRSAQGVRVVKTPNGAKPRYFGGRNTENVQVKVVSIILVDLKNTRLILSPQSDFEPDLTKYNSIPQAVRNWTWAPGLLGI